MKAIRACAIALIASLLVLLPLNLRSASAATYTDQTNVSFTSSGGLTSKYHVYAAGVTAPAGLLLQFHGDGAYEFKNPTSSYSLGGTNGIVAKARARNLITVPVLAPDASGSVTWWESGSANADYVRDLIADLQSRYSVRTDRIWLVGYSGGAQFITQFFLPKYSSLVSGGCGAVIFGGGGKPRVAVSPLSAAVRANFALHWYTGSNDTRDSDGWNALADAKAGQAWYAANGFSTSYQWPAGVDHDLDGTFGPIVAQQLDAHPAPGTGPTSSPTPPAPTPPAPTPPAPTPPSPTPSNWVTAVTPSRTGVTVRLNIPSTASGRTTLNVYSSRGSSWNQYTSRTGSVDLTLSNSLRSGRSYTFTVVNGGKQVGAGTFTTLQ